MSQRDDAILPLRQTCRPRRSSIFISLQTYGSKHGVSSVIRTSLAMQGRHRSSYIINNHGQSRGCTTTPNQRNQQRHVWR